MAEVSVTVASVGVSVYKRDATDRFLQQNCHLKMQIEGMECDTVGQYCERLFPVMFDRCHRCEHFAAEKKQIGVESFLKRH